MLILLDHPVKLYSYGEEYTDQTENTKYSYKEEIHTEDNNAYGEEKQIRVISPTVTAEQPKIFRGALFDPKARDWNEVCPYSI